MQEPAAVREFKARRDQISPLLPRSLFRFLRNATAGQGERRLAVAVLEEAVDCLEERRMNLEVEGRLTSWEAEQWFESEDAEWPFSFMNVCLVLHLDAEAIRDRIRLRRQGNSPRLEPPLPALLGNSSRGGVVIHLPWDHPDESRETERSAS
jgi:hypothetical protein